MTRPENAERSDLSWPANYRLFRPHDPAMLLVSVALVVLLLMLAWFLEQPALLLLAILLFYLHATFFLFCNIFHVRRWKELTWGGLFVAGISIARWWLAPFMALLLCGCAMVTVTVIICFSETRRSDYHGHPKYRPRR